jgi:membrane protein YqaA with SNARE-associated domain
VGVADVMSVPLRQVQLRRSGVKVVSILSGGASKSHQNVWRHVRQATITTMDHGLSQSVVALLAWLTLPAVGLPAVFVIAFVSATLLPMGSEPAVAALVQSRPELFWSAVLVATAGNTLGGALTWWMGRGAGRLAPKLHDKAVEARAMRWLTHFGPKACLLSWLPVVGDPLCAVAGWLQLPFWPCVGYMALSKFARYATMTWVIREIVNRL